MNVRSDDATLRVGLVAPRPPPNGGMALQARQLAELLAGEGIAVEQLATNGPYRPAFVAPIPGLRALCRLLPYLLAVWRLAGRVDVIHLMANSGWSWQLFSAPVLWLGWLRGTPVIVNYRGGEAPDYFRRSFSRVKPSLRKAAAVVVPSGFLEAVFKHYGEDALVIPNIIDRDIFKPGSAVAEGACTRPFTLVITRNLEPLYGIDTAIRAFAQVFRSDPALRLRIAGSGPARASLHNLAAQLGVSGAVTFEGRLDRQGIVALYAEADAFINPSTVDNMPNSVLEALACGLPVISSAVGGVPFIVRHGETALLVPPADVGALAAAIHQLRSDPDLRAQLRGRGLAQVEQYTWASVRQRWLELYISLCSHKRRVLL
ncbi:MAG: glycosyltransferase family 4 protein [Porticoccaceae bacterium]